MITVYIHIGTHKTGTTAIQKYLSSNQEKLLSHGILYPLSGRPKLPPHGHHKLPWSMVKKREPYEYSEWDKLREEIDSSNAEKVIISAEDFSLFDTSKIKLVKNLLSNYHTKIIAYIRRQDSFFESMYCSEVKNGMYWNSAGQFFLENQERGDYYKWLQPWQELYGKNNLILKVYEKEQLPDGLASSFLECICANHLDFIKLDDFQPANVTPSKKVIKVMRLLNLLLLKGMGSPRLYCRKLYLIPLERPQNLTARIARKLPDILVSNDIIPFLEKLEIMKKFENSNRKVAQEYLGRRDSRLFYRPPPSEDR